MVSFDGYQEWKRSTSLTRSNNRCVPLVWSENVPALFDLDAGTRVEPEADGSVRPRGAYHEIEGKRLKRISGTLIFQPIEGLYMPPLDIDLS